MPGSIRVEGKATGKLEIGSVDSRRLFVPRTDGAAAETERRRLEDEIERLLDDRAAFEAQVQAAETQKIPHRQFGPTADPAGSSPGAERGEDWPEILALIGTGSGDVQPRAPRGADETARGSIGRSRTSKVSSPPSRRRARSGPRSRSSSRPVPPLEAQS